MLLTAKTTAIAAVAALSVGMASAPAAHAWGKKEQGFLAGVVTAIIIDELIEGNRGHAAPAPAPAPAPVVVEPRPTHVSIHDTPAAQAFNSYSRSERKAIQRQLRAYGYYRGAVDGSFGRGTYNAIVAYARDAGASGNLKTTGGAFALYDGLLF